ncbi:MAG: hypothetical protein ACOYJA_03000 [Christensenellales bacterium]|jgi:hypothetical protein
MRKVFVEVITRTDADGMVTPLAVVWEDGTRYVIDRVLDRRQAASTRVGGQGIRYTVRIGGRETFLFLESPKWFVEAK